MTEKKNVRLRFAPSPTGYLHIGGLRTALFNYLYARHHGGQFILRIEDTDRNRFVKGALENLIDVLNWAKLDYDEGVKKADNGLVQVGGHGPYIQSERVDEGIYQKYADQLVEEGKAYHCFCSQERIDQVREEQKARGETPRYDGHCRDIPLEESKRRVESGEEHILRMKLPADTDITFHDEIKGDITINTDEMDDQVLMKSDGFPTYHFAVVIDDHLMDITHVVRGEEWISSTPKHIFLYQSFGWEAPSHVHLPTVLGQDHKKLSKRNGDVSVELFIDRGYLQEALINYIALLGWSPTGNEEILSMDEIIQQFDFDRVSNTGGIFDVKKLDWMNQQYITALPVEDCQAYIRNFLTDADLISEDYPDEKLRLITETYQNRIEHFDQVPEMTKHLFASAEELDYSDEAKDVLVTEQAQMLVATFADKVKASSFDEDFAKGVVKEIQKETGIKGKDLWFPVRAAVVGQTSGPDFTNTLLILGKEEVESRLAYVQENMQ